MSYSETLKLRVNNASEILNGLKRCCHLLKENNIDVFFDTQAQLKKLFEAEDRFAKEMENLNTKHIVEEKYAEGKKQLLEILGDAHKLVEENKEQLVKVMKSVLKEQKKHDAVGNAASKYYPAPKIIPKFIDLKS